MDDNVRVVGDPPRQGSGLRYPEAVVRYLHARGLITSASGAAGVMIDCCVSLHELSYTTLLGLPKTMLYLRTIHEYNASCRDMGSRGARRANRCTRTPMALA